jgi:3-phenylpropionate/cinnamic acid dioxygenase small subunit
MTTEAKGRVRDDRLAAMVRQFEIERFYYEEAALLDAHRYEDWLALLADDAYYFMPIRRTRMQRELDKEFTEPGEMAYFDDTKEQLEVRVKKLATGRSWAEDPPSRTRHMITNVRVTTDNGDELLVESNFHLYRTRLKSEEDSWIGSRHDTLRRVDDAFQIARRTILLEQTVLLARNLSNFF